MTKISKEQLCNEKKILSDVKKDWIDEYPKKFYRCGKPEKGQGLYDVENLERIQRFAGAPDEYIKERIELNKEVSKNYHKIYTSILITVILGTGILTLKDTITNIGKLIVEEKWITEGTLSWAGWYYVIIITLVLVALFMINWKKTTLLRWTGLYKVIIDSEIEIYVLTKIQQERAQKRRKSLVVVI